MRDHGSVWRRRARLLGGFAAPALLSLSGGLRPATAAEPPPALPPAVVAPAPAAPQLFDLASARQAAVDHQPAVAAARDSLAAARMKADALENIRFGAILAHDLPVRRKQAACGVAIAAAAVDAAEWDARHAATVTYLSALYALEQQRTADAIRQRLTDLKTVAKTALDKGRKDVSEEQVEQIDAFLKVVEGRRQEAVEGYQRALVGLREAVGLGPECPVQIVGKELPDVRTKADRDLIVQLAVGRRGEVIEATTAVNVYCLEVDAQGALLRSPARTFASGADIHAQVLLPPLHDPDYRPGAVAPEMPVTLTGSRQERQDIARAYHDRAGAVAEKTRNLIGAEADDAFLRWKQADEEAPKLEQAATQLENYSDTLSHKFNTEQAVYPTVDDVLNAGLKATQIRLDANQAKFRRLATLANLERVTAGGFDPGLVAPPAPEPKP